MAGMGTAARGLFGPGIGGAAPAGPAVGGMPAGLGPLAGITPQAIAAAIEAQTRAPVGRPREPFPQLGGGGNPKPPGPVTPPGTPTNTWNSSPWPVNFFDNGYPVPTAIPMGLPPEVIAAGIQSQMQDAITSLPDAWDPASMFGRDKKKGSLLTPWSGKKNKGGVPEIYD